MEIVSHIRKSEVVQNTARKTRNEVESFYPVFVVGEKKRHIALFTDHELDKAIKRAERNIEDVLGLSLDDKDAKIAALRDKSGDLTSLLLQRRKRIKELESSVEKLEIALKAEASRPWYKKLFGLR